MGNRGLQRISVVAFKASQTPNRKSSYHVFVDLWGKVYNKTIWAKSWGLQEVAFGLDFKASADAIAVLQLSRRRSYPIRWRDSFCWCLSYYENIITPQRKCLLSWLSGFLAMLVGTTVVSVFTVTAARSCSHSAFFTTWIWRRSEQKRCGRALLSQKQDVCVPMKHVFFLFGC